MRATTTAKITTIMMVMIHLFSAMCMASEALFVSYFRSAPSPWAFVAFRLGFRTRHVATNAG